MQPSKNKIVVNSELSSLINKLKKINKKIVHCHGTFDLIHAGHIKYLQKSKTFGDILIVSVTANKFVNKGPERPVFDEDIRLENLAALSCVDYVCINNALSAEKIIRIIKPDFYVKGSDYQNESDDITGNIKKEKKAVISCGGKIVFTNEITFSSSKLLNNHFDIYSKETKDFLKNFSTKYELNQLIDQINSLNDLKVLVIGDAILDEYHYVKPLGLTGKGNILAAQYSSQEIFAGGSIAVANHISSFVNKVTLVTGLGDKNNKESFIRKSLKKNVEAKFFYFKDSQTLTKRRFVDNDLNKFFEIYLFCEKPTLGVDYKKLIKYLNKLSNFDVVIVADYGNGFIDKNLKDTICKKSNFLAVNTQLNSANKGFNVITQYNRANFISLNEPELRIAKNNRSEDIKKLMSDISNNLNSQFISTTMGTNGVLMLNNRKNYYSHVPALSSRVIDRVGAGDAYLSLASIALAGGLEFDIANFFGSVAAAMDVQIVCNRESIHKINLIKYITSILK